MSLFRPVSVEDEPETVLSRWIAFEAHHPTEPVTRHFAGYVDATGHGRVCSPIQSWDHETRTAITRSGRRYRLEGPPGLSMDVAYVLAHWQEINGVMLSEISEDYE